MNGLQQGRVEMLRSTPRPGPGWSPAGITLVATGALAAVAASVGSPLEFANATRIGLTSPRFAAALGPLATLAAERSPSMPSRFDNTPGNPC